MLQVPPGVQHMSDSLAHLCRVGKYGVEDKTLIIANMASCLALLVKKKKQNKYYHEYNGDTVWRRCIYREYRNIPTRISQQR